MGLTKVGGGTQQLTGTAANTFTGATTVNAGTLALGKPADVAAVSSMITIGDNSGTSDRRRLDADNQIPDSATVTLNATAGGTAATFDINGHCETIGGLSSAASAVAQVTNGAASTTSTLTIDGTLTAAGTIAFDVNSAWMTPGTDYDQLVVSGAVDLSGATLTFNNTDNTTAPAANAV